MGRSVQSSLFDWAKVSWANIFNKGKAKECFQICYDDAKKWLTSCFLPVWVLVVYIVQWG